ncbi:YVTN repeat-like/Quino protein amine dehydrogenase [Thozetella sp. PMI_491]|nr:YVTN repeat-like/Quino protein amine dehydrogenase [Thozetella sp. PMI_491]
MPTARDATYDSRAEEHNTYCHPETRLDLLRTITEWADEPVAKTIFWLNGMAGTGKSTVSRTVSQRFKDRGILGASFFFKRGEADRGNATLLFTTIAEQLSRAFPALRRLIADAIHANPHIQHRALREQFKELILDPLDKISTPMNLAVVVDALDECDGDADIRNIILLLARASSLGSVRLRVFITSRPELPIRLGFTKVEGSYQDFILHEIPEPIVEHDISVYLSNELIKIRNDYNSGMPESLQLPSSWPGQDKIETLVHMALPLFIFAATICRFIGDDVLLDPEEKLRQVLEYHTLSEEVDHPKLDFTYRPVLNQFMTGCPSSQAESLLDGFRNIVGTIILLAEPLSGFSLAALLELPPKVVFATLNRLHSVLKVPSTQNAPIRTFHLSFRDFLLDSSRCSREFWIDEAHRHEIIATKCIQVMNRFLKKDICSLVIPATSLSGVDPGIIEASLPENARYACMYWVHHLEHANTRLRDGDQVHTFLLTHFLHWLEALSLLKRADESLRMVRTLETLIEVRTRFEKFLQDANRFILNCTQIITACPLQLYSSAIFFSPKSSVVRHSFIHEPSMWLSTQSKIQDDWTACVQTLEGHLKAVTSIVYSDDGRCLASLSDNIIKIWNPSPGSCTQTLESSLPCPLSITLSPDGGLLAIVANRVGSIEIWNLATGICEHNYESLEAERWGCTFSPDGHWLVSASQTSFQLWDLTVKPINLVLEAESCHCTLSQDSSWIASAAHKTVQLWDLQTGPISRMLLDHLYEVDSLKFSPDGCWLASTAAGRGSIKLWDLRTRGIAIPFLEHRYMDSTVAFSPDSRFISWECAGGITIYDLTSGVYKELQGFRHLVEKIVFSADDRWLVTVSVSGKIYLWNIDTGNCERSWEGHTGNDVLISISPDGHWLASACSSDATVKLWDAVADSCVQRLDIYGKINYLDLDPGSSCLRTNMGCFHLKLDGVVPRLHPGCCMSSDGTWIAINGEKMLWLPPDYRSFISAVSKSFVAIFDSSGQPLILKSTRHGINNVT